MPRSLAIWGGLAVLAVTLALAASACVESGPAPTASPRPRPTFTPVGAGSAGCESCHSDKEKLKEVAAAEKDSGEAACVG